MSNPHVPGSGLDDERFDDLVDHVEVLLTAFFKEVMDRDNIEVNDGDLEPEVEDAVGYFSLVLAALDAQIISASTSENGQETYEIKLTVPTGDIQEVMRQVMESLDSEDFD